MKQSTIKKLLGVAGIGAAVVLLTSCTANFCSDVDKASMSYPYEQGVTVYLTEEQYQTIASAYPTVIAYQESVGAAGPAYEYESATLNEETGLHEYVYEGRVWKYIPCTPSGTIASAEDYLSAEMTFTADKASDLESSVIASAISNGIKVPTLSYFAAIDDYTLTYATEAAAWAGGEAVDYKTFANSVYVGCETDVDFTTSWAVNPYDDPESNGGEEGVNAISHSVLRTYGYLKFSSGRYLSDGTFEGDGTYFGNYEAWLNALRGSSDPYLGLDGCPTNDFQSSYKSFVSGKVSSVNSCIVTVNNPDGYGHYGANSDWRVTIEQKSWGYAWSKGFLEGLLVYPISWMVDTFAYGMDPALSGVGQIVSLILVTLIVRGVLFLLTFKTTMDQQKMQALQPQLAKLQAKYPNSNTNAAEKQRLAQEQSALYKRNKINPLSQIIVLFIQFPVFICVWSGLQGSAALSTGQVLNLQLSSSISSVLMNFGSGWYTNATGWWTALILFLLMAASQIMAMMLPRIIQKARNKKVQKLGRNPAEDQTANRMKWVTYIMLAFTIVMGFMLPAAMGVYWLIGGLISMTQTAVTQLIMSKNAKKKGNK